MYARRRRTIITLLFLIAGLLVAVDLVRGNSPGGDQLGAPAAATRPSSASAAPSPTPSLSSSAKPSPTAPPTVLQDGPGTYRIVAGTGEVAGQSGTLLRYRVAVEDGITNVDPAGFAAAAEKTLGDPRSWIAGGDIRLQRVGPDAAYDFTLYLATPKTVDALCAPLLTDGYTSCRNGNSVAINLARWLLGVPNYGASMEVYREYAINHEVGHRLGHGHELCTGNGKLAPVMEQQTLGLHGCVANAWPYVEGKRYSGPPGAYGGNT